MERIGIEKQLSETALTNIECISYTSPIDVFTTLTKLVVLNDTDDSVEVEIYIRRNKLRDILICNTNIPPNSRFDINNIGIIIESSEMVIAKQNSMVGVDLIICGIQDMTTQVLSLI